MSNLLNTFSTREIALFVWFLVFLVFAAWRKAVRHMMSKLIKAFFRKSIILVFCLLIAYIFLIIRILNHLDFWEITLLKDTCIWILFSGIALFLNMRNVKEAVYFSKLIRDNIRIIFIIEFIMNFYTFSLFGELIIIPIVSILTILHVYAEHSSQIVNGREKVSRIINYTLGFIGFSILGYVTYMTIVESDLLLTYTNLKIFIYPIILFISTLPYFYFLALFMNYENFLTSIKSYDRLGDSSIRKDLFMATMRYSNFNLNSLNRVKKKQHFFDASKDNPFVFVKKVAKKPKFIIGNIAKLTVFNDIQKVMNILSENGIGQFEDWKNLLNDEQVFYSFTRPYFIGDDDLLQIPNSIAYNLIGRESYINQLDLVLDISNQKKRQQSVIQFVELAKLTIDSLSIVMPESLSKSITTSEGFSYKYETHLVSLNYENFGKSERYTLSIITELNSMNL